MAFKKNWKKNNSKKRGGAKKKYSYNERAEYHRAKSRAFVDRFRYTTSSGSVGIHFDKMEEALKKDKRAQYSSGYSDFSYGDRLGEKATSGEKKGYEAAKKLRERALNHKF